MGGRYPMLGLRKTCNGSAPPCSDCRFIISNTSERPKHYEGVMAQDVLQVMPGAVSLGADGYYRVNYGALGTSMRQLS